MLDADVLLVPSTEHWRSRTGLILKGPEILRTLSEHQLQRKVTVASNKRVRLSFES